MLSARITRLWTVGLLAAASAACFDFDLSLAPVGPICHPSCGKPLVPYPPYTEFILGITPGQVNGITSVGTLQVGDTVVFRLVGDYGPTLTPRDTITKVTWSLTEPAVGSMASDSSGRGTFVAGRPGRTDVRANGGGHTMWACHAARTDNMCTSVVWIEVQPPAP
jgi:hypothetical protein